jgi:hypothetical protein
MQDMDATCKTRMQDAACTRTDAVFIAARRCPGTHALAHNPPDTHTQTHAVIPARRAGIPSAPARRHTRVRTQPHARRCALRLGRVRHWAAPLDPIDSNRQSG